VIHFVNADLIAGGLSPLRPELTARQAGRLVLMELTLLAKTREDFAFENTLSGRTYLRLLTGWKATGIGSKSYFYLYRPFSLRFTGLQPVYGKVDMMFRAPMCSDAWIAVSTIFMCSIARWPIPGQSTTIQGTRHAYGRETYEKEKPDGEPTVFPSCWPCTPESRQGRSQNRQDVWHAHLCVGKRQSRGEEAVIQPIPSS
jgi:hypothetical protein